MSGLGVLSAKVALDTVDFNKNLTALKRELKIAKQETQMASQGVSGFGSASKLSAGHLQGLSKQINLQKQALEAYDQKVKTAIDTKGRESKAAQNAIRDYNNSANELNKLNAQYDILSRTMAYQESGYAKISGGMEKVGNGAVVAGDKMISTGKKWTAAGVAVGGALALTAKAAINYEDSFSNVTKTVDGTTQELNGLSDEIRQMATEIPVAATDLAELASVAGQLGIKTPNIAEFTRVIADLGVATNLTGEQGASQLAKFANITKMSQADFSRLGSTLVELGNNFATTEADIMSMSMRLGSAGTQIGLSQAEILGVATALSSVGIEAEAGGSSFSKLMINMQLATETGVASFSELNDIASNSGVSWEQVSSAVRNGGKELKSVAGQMGLTSGELKKMYKEADDSAVSLQQFADVAGLTSDAFADMFKSDPSAAIAKFVEGLATAEERGTSAIKILDDMGITEVRLRDTLLRAANASGIFNDAVKTGSEAWKENTALTKEAETKYGTTANQIQIAKNKIIDLAISFGNELLPAIADLMESGEPIVDWLKDMIENFADASPETKKFVLGLAGIAIVGGPVLTLLGGLTKGFGSIVLGGAKAISFLGKWKFGLLGADAAATAAQGGLSALELGLGTTSVKGALASKILTSVATSFGGIALPAALAVAGTAAVAGGFYLLSKRYEENQLAGERWGISVTKEQDKVIGKTMELRNNATADVQAFADGVTGSAEKIVENNAKIVESIQKTIDKEHERKIKAAEEFDDPEMTKRAKARADYDNKLAEDRFVMVKRNLDRINQITQNASEHNRTISDREQAFIVANYQKVSAKQLEMAGYSKSEILAIETAYQTNLSKISDYELGQRRQKLQKSLGESRKDYDEDVKNVGTIWKKGTDNYNREIENLNKNYKQKTEGMVLAIAKVAEQQGQSLESMSEQWKNWGWTTEEVAELVSNSANKTEQNLDMWAKSTEEAGMQWNALAIDPKTGEIRTNMADVLLEIAKTDGGWEQLEFMTKNADLTTNAKEEIGIAMGQAGKWNSLYLSEKLLVCDGDQAKVDLYDLIDRLGYWNNYNTDRKELGIDAADAQWALADTEEKMNRWLTIPLNEKKLLVNNNDVVEKILNSEEHLNRWYQLPGGEKQLLADNSDLMSKVFSSEEVYQRWLSLPEQQKKLLAENAMVLDKVMTSEEAYQRWLQMPEEEKQMYGNNEDIMFKILTSEGAWNRWVELPATEKQLLANNASVMNAVLSSESAYNQWIGLPEQDKKMLGNNTDLLAKVFSSETEYNEWMRLPEKDKLLLANNRDAISKLDLTKGSIRDYNSNYNPQTKIAKVAADTSGATAAKQAIDNVPNYSEKRIVVTYEGRNTGAAAIHSEKGTNFHPDSTPVIVNDQKGSLYREAVRYPWTDWFIPEGRDVLLPGARGMQVMPAGMTKAKFKAYAAGTGLNDEMFNTVVPFRQPKQLAGQSQIIPTQPTNDQSARLVELFMDFLANFDPTIETSINMDQRQFVKAITPGVTKEQKRHSDLIRMINGGGV